MKRTPHCHPGTVTKQGQRLHCHDMIPLTDKDGKFVGRACIESGCDLITTPSGNPSDPTTKAHLARVDARYRTVKERR